MQAVKQSCFCLTTGRPTVVTINFHIGKDNEGYDKIEIDNVHTSSDLVRTGDSYNWDSKEIRREHHFLMSEVAKELTKRINNE